MASANDESQRLQSNEEVIEELTRDLESSCVRADGDRGTDGSSDARSKGAIDGDSWDVVDKECNEDGDDKVQITEEDVDEVLLKDRDLLLTESELEVRSSCFRIEYLFRNLLQLFSVSCNLPTFAGVEMRGGEFEAGGQRPFQKRRIRTSDIAVHAGIANLSFSV